MRQLSDILIEKSSKMSYAAIARALGGLTGQQIGQYTQKDGPTPSLEFAIKWKRAFNENLIDLMFEPESGTIVAEPAPEYRDLRTDLMDCQQKLIACWRTHAMPRILLLVLGPTPLNTPMLILI